PRQVDPLPGRFAVPAGAVRCRAALNNEALAATPPARRAARALVRAGDRPGADGAGGRRGQPAAAAGRAAPGCDREMAGRAHRPADRLRSHADALDPARAAAATGWIAPG